MIYIKEGEEWKTVFWTLISYYKYLVIWEGLTNAPTIFQRLLYNVLRSFLDKTYVLYLDDILVFSKDKVYYTQDVQDILTVLKKVDLQLKPEKCKFYTKEVTFLGFMVNTQGILIDPMKVSTVLE